MLGDRFVERYPHYWLVWEPGEFVVPRGNSSTVETALPPGKKNAPAPEPRWNDPLCFVLDVKAGLKVGRAEGNDLVLSDETVSRHHCTLEHDGTGWVVSCSPASHTPLLVQGERVPPGESKDLATGSRLSLGRVKLTLVSAWSLVRRIDGQPG